jgi:hypothetical protein
MFQPQDYATTNFLAVAFSLGITIPLRIRKISASLTSMVLQDGKKHRRVVQTNDSTVTTLHGVMYCA